jgi:AbrB family looped-hinge helix DNA binding protein
MLVELRGRSQITIPAEIIKELGAVEGDKFEVVAKDGMLIFVPVVVYPKSEVERLKKLAIEAENDGELPIYDNAEDMIKALGFSPDEL